MSFATVTALPMYEQVVVPVLRRDERMERLQDMAKIVIDGAGLPDWLIRSQVPLLAHRSLKFLQPMDAWTKYIAAQRRVLACEDGHPDFRDIEPWMAEDDRNEALAFLLDGERP